MITQISSIGGSIVYKASMEVSEKPGREKRGALGSCLASEFRRREGTTYDKCWQELE